MSKERFMHLKKISSRHSEALAKDEATDIQPTKCDCQDNKTMVEISALSTKHHAKHHSKHY